MQSPGSLTIRTDSHTPRSRRRNAFVSCETSSIAIPVGLARAPSEPILPWWHHGPWKLEGGCIMRTSDRGLSKEAGFARVESFISKSCRPDDECYHALMAAVPLPSTTAPPTEPRAVAPTEPRAVAPTEPKPARRPNPRPSRRPNPRPSRRANPALDFTKRTQLQDGKLCGQRG
jgi:hypothetical protein